MSQIETPSRAFTLSLIAGILILINTTLLGIVTTWFLAILPVLPGSSGNDPMILYLVTAIGLIFGALVVLGALLLKRNPEHVKAWGILIIVFSIAGTITGGGFVIGFILGIIGGVSALRWKPKT
jgi:hypothetical protein